MFRTSYIQKILKSLLLKLFGGAICFYILKVILKNLKKKILLFLFSINNFLVF
jgi:hypothetical protein